MNNISPFFTDEQLTRFHPEIFTLIECRIHGHRLAITLNRPQKRNAMNRQMIREIAYAVSYAAQSDLVWVVSLEANGSVFCAGADLREFAGESASVSGGLPEPLRDIVLGEVFESLDKPLVAKVQGPVMAGGFLLIGACTHVIAAESATFGLPEIQRGLWPFQVMAMLEPTLGRNRLLDWCMRGHIISAQEAALWGLVSEVCPADALEHRFKNMLDELLLLAPLAVRRGIRAYKDLKNMPHTARHAYLKSELDRLLSSNDAQEGLQAFIEKRQPKWRNC